MYEICPSLKIQCHLGQLLEIRILIANNAMKIQRAIGKTWCTVFALDSTALQASSRSSQYSGAFIGKSFQICS
jgi:hypothetical protein